MDPLDPGDSLPRRPPPPPPPSSAPPKRLAFQIPLLENIEDVDTYGPGGHYPVNLGDVIGHRFKVIHKLGNGGFALVWLAQDLDLQRNVALKILRADAPDRETSILSYLRNATGMTRITKLHDTFTVNSPNGPHQCLVLDLGGPSLQLVAMYMERLPLPFLKSAGRRLADSLAALHAASVCHGDLTHSNVLFEVKGLQEWTEEEVYRNLGQPKTDPLLLLDGKPAPPFAPKHVVDALDYSTLDIGLLSGDILITDFGEAFFEDDTPKGLGTPATFAAPELLFGYSPSRAADLWALGCVLFEIYTYRVLTPTFFGSDEEALAMAIETIGALPEAWQISFYDKINPLKDEGPGKKHRWFDDNIERTRALDSQLSRQLHRSLNILGLSATDQFDPGSDIAGLISEVLGFLSPAYQNSEGKQYLIKYMFIGFIFYAWRPEAALRNQKSS